jgi:glycosyltransferase involved in cell wall biosynthesis
MIRVRYWTTSCVLPKEQNRVGPNSKKIKICRIIFEFPPLGIGGSVTHTIELAKHISPHCERQFFIVPEANEDTQKIDKSYPFEVHRVKYPQFRLLNYLKSKYLKWLPLMPLNDMAFCIAAIRKCIWLHRKYGIEIIHAHGIAVGPAAVISARIIKKPVVLMLDGTLSSYTKLSGFYESVIFRLMKCNHYFIIDNGGPALTVFQKLKNIKDRFSPVFINISTSRICPRNKNIRIWNQIGLKDQNKFVFISVHNLEKIQGVDYSILAFKKLIDTYHIQDAVLLIVGGGLERDRLENLAKDSSLQDKIFFTGPVDNSIVPDYYSLSNVALSTSMKINSNTATIEAMACKVPVIAFNCGNTADFLMRHQENMLLVPKGSVEELAKAMFQLYNDSDLCQKLGANAREFIVTHRNWDERIRLELEVYNRLINNQ